MLEIDNIKFQYPEQTHPLKFALNVPENTALVVAGISGSGKSTLLNLIAGFLHPDSGDIRWREKSILELAPAARPISMLFQSDNLFAHLDVWTNIALGVDAGLAIDTESAEIIAQSMADLGIGDMQMRPIPTLSGGQQQRVALVRALVRARLHAAGGAGGGAGSRSLLLLDEPFSALDPITKADCLAVVRRMVDDFGITAILVTHDASDAAVLDADVFSLPAPC